MTPSEIKKLTALRERATLTPRSAMQVTPAQLRLIEKAFKEALPKMTAEDLAIYNRVMGV